MVEDYEPFRQIISLELEGRQDVQLIGEASDGLEGLQKAQELQPELILLDIVLPRLNGLEVARRILELSPKCKILFVTSESSPDVVDEAFRVGVLGYLHKTDASRELLTAVRAVVRGERFVSSTFADLDFL